MDLECSTHMIDGWDFNYGASLYRARASLIESRVSWSAESCLDHPDPARASYIARVPERVHEVLDLQIGGPVRTFVRADGLSDDGLGTPTRDHLAYMEGFLDEVQKERVAYDEIVGDDLTREAWHAVPYAYSFYAAPAASNVWAATANQYGQVDEIWTTAWNGSSSTGAKRLMVRNYDTDPVTVYFKARFHTTQTVRPAWGTGASGYRRPGKFVICSNVRNPWHCDVYHSFGGSALFPSLTDVTDFGAGGSYTDVDMALTVDAGEQVELIPCVAQTSPLVGRPRQVQLRVNASDALAKLGRTYVGADPWAVQRASGRIEFDLKPAVNGAVPMDSYPYRDGSGWEPGPDLLAEVFVRPQDVDNQSALDIYRRTVAAAGRAALGLAMRVGISWALQPSRKIVLVAGQGKLVENAGEVSRVPSTRSIEDVEVQMSTDAMMNRVAANRFRPEEPQSPSGQYVFWPQTETSDAMEDTYSMRTYGVVSRTWKSDLWCDNGVNSVASASPALWNRLALALGAQSTPRYYPAGGMRVVARDLGSIVGLSEIIDNAQRYGRVVALTGERPVDIGEYHRQHGGTFGFNGSTGKWVLEMVLEPVDYSGADAGTFVQAQTRTELRLDRMMNITIDEMRDVAL